MGIDQLDIPIEKHTVGDTPIEWGSDQEGFWNETIKPIIPLQQSAF